MSRRPCLQGLKVDAANANHNDGQRQLAGCACESRPELLQVSTRTGRQNDQQEIPVLHLSNTGRDLLSLMSPMSSPEGALVLPRWACWSEAVISVPGPEEVS